MNKKVLLVYPEIPLTYWSFKYSLEFIGKKAVFPPLGLLTVAAMLPHDWKIDLIDLNVSSFDHTLLPQYDMVMISAMLVQKQSFAEIASLCKEYNVPVVAGGPYPTSLWQSIPNVDHFVLNEAEVTLPKFLHDLQYGIPHHVYTSHEKPSLDVTPVPRFDIIDLKPYSSVPLQFSRGCPFNCEFCDIISLFGRNPRTKSPQQFLAELDAVYATGFRESIFIVDDNFIGNKAKAKELLKAIITWQIDHSYPFSFQTEASVNLAHDKELMHLMYEAGFDMVFLGIETPVVSSLQKAGKTQNTKEDLLENVKIIQQHGMEVSGGFIVGFDDDPENVFDLQSDFIQASGIPIAMVGILDALPNTRLYDRLQNEGRLICESNGNNTHKLAPNFIPKMPVKKLIDGYINLLKTIYSPPNYFKRCLTLIKRVPANRVVYRQFTFKEFKALVLSLIKQGFSSYSIHYFKFLINTLRMRPKLFSEAIALAIKGYHLFKITEKLVAEYNKSLKEEEITDTVDQVLITTMPVNPINTGMVHTDNR
ncbi:MAG: B12-binding domain-containing radical SAM protein [Spirochaetes bacterium]|nr:B12-binding domain-containing radical SAM protein [Spirochaetota bacterium]